MSSSKCPSSVKHSGFGGILPCFRLSRQASVYVCMSANNITVRAKQGKTRKIFVTKRQFRRNKIKINLLSHSFFILSLKLSCESRNAIRLFRLEWFRNEIFKETTNLSTHLQCVELKKNCLPTEKYLKEIYSYTILL